MENKHFFERSVCFLSLSWVVLMLSAVVIGGCALNPFAKTEEQKKQTKIQLDQKRVNQLKQAFMKYHRDTGDYPKTFLDFERYLKNSHVFQNVDIKSRKAGGHTITFKMKQKDRTYSLIQFLVNANRESGKIEITYQRPDRDLVQRRVFELDGHRARRFGDKAKDKQPKPSESHVRKQRNHEAYVD